MRKKKRSQISLFLIIGILFLVGIVSVFILKKNISIEMIQKREETPKEIFEKCFLDKIHPIINKISSQGGYISPEKYLVYKGIKASYLCYTPFEKRICERNDALFSSRIEEEIAANSRTYVENCFNLLREFYEKRGYDINFGPTDFSVEIRKKEVFAKIKKELVISREQSSQTENDFGVLIPSSLFDMVVIANEILNKEVLCNCGRESCTADTSSLMSQYIDFSIDFFIGSNNEKVYSIENKFTKEKFNFALRNCVLGAL